MPPGRARAATRPSTRSEPEEAPLTEYEKQKMEQVMRNSRVFRSLGIKEAADILKKSRPKKATNATREDSGSLYQPADGEDGEEVEQGVFDKDLEHEVCKSSARTSKRVMAVALRGQDEPARMTRQRVKEMATANEVPTTDSQDGSTEDALMAANDNTQSNNRNELPTEGRCITKRHLGRDLDIISRGLRDKIPVSISDGKLRPEVPLQAAKLALESQFTIDKDAVPVKDAFSDLLKRGQRQMRYKLKKQYFNGIPANEVRTTSPLNTMTDMEWKQLVDLWSNPKHKEKCLKNKDSRELVQYHLSSRSYVAQCYVMKQTKFKDMQPNAIDIFKDTHCSTKSGFNEQAKDAIAKMEAYIAQPTEQGQDPKTPVQAVAHVLPKTTFLHNVGMQSAAMKRNAKTAAMNDRVNELESEIAN